MRNHEWALAASAAVAVFVLGLAELARVPMTAFGAAGPTGAAGVGFVACLAIAVGASRPAPSVALGLAWLAGLIQVMAGVPLLVTQGALLVVLFGAARWGRLATAALAGCSVCLVPLLALAWIQVTSVNAGIGARLLYELLGAEGVSVRLSRLLVLGFAVLGLPYLLGLALRFRDRETSAQAARQTAEIQVRQAQEIARLREAQNQLARDVHDVVGHSLTVILAQAEAAQFIDELDRLKQTMQTIASSARTSLRDVRQVLAAGREPAAGAESTANRKSAAGGMSATGRETAASGDPIAPEDVAAGQRGDLDTLIEAVRASGTTIVSTEAGPARPLPPELDAVAYRVLQEMLTNAIKHGRRDRPVYVERHWPEMITAGAALRISTRNFVGVTPADGLPRGGGQGLAGMRRRLESVGGGLETHRGKELEGEKLTAEAETFTAEGETFTAVALVPVRSSPTGWPA